MKYQQSSQQEDILFTCKMLTSQQKEVTFGILYALRDKYICQKNPTSVGREGPILVI